MKKDNKIPTTDTQPGSQHKKAAYHPPTFTVYGTVSKLTQGASGSGGDGGTMFTPGPCL